MVNTHTTKSFLIKGAVAFKFNTDRATSTWFEALGACYLTLNGVGVYNGIKCFAETSIAGGGSAPIITVEVGNSDISGDPIAAYDTTGNSIQMYFKAALCKFGATIGPGVTIATVATSRVRDIDAMATIHNPYTGAELTGHVQRIYSAMGSTSYSGFTSNAYNGTVFRTNNSITLKGDAYAINQ